MIINLSASAEELSMITDSTAKYNRQFGYGVGNLFDLKDPINYKPGIYFDFGQGTDWENVNLKVSMLGKYRTYMDGNVRQHEVIPFIVSVGLEKFWVREKLVLSVGASIYYSMSLRKSTISGFQGDDYGVGISPMINVMIPLKENLGLVFGYQYGIGLYREFNNLGTVTNATLVPKGEAIKNLSFGVMHYF